MIPDVDLVPEFITHYYRSDRGPFLNLCDLDEVELDEVMRDLRGAAECGTSERRFGSRYMAVRRATETLLRSRFVDRGGRPTRQSPHYFVLGESPWFRGLYRDAGEVRIRLDALESDEVSVTYPDSVTSMGLLGEFGIHVAPREFHGHVYRVEELPWLARRFGLPTGARPDTYNGHQFDSTFEHYLEVQVWSDSVLDHALTR